MPDDSGRLELVMALAQWSRLLRIVSSSTRVARDAVAVGRLGVADFRAESDFRPTSSRRFLVRNVESVSRTRAAFLVRSQSPSFVAVPVTDGVDGAVSVLPQTWVDSASTTSTVIVLEIGVGSAAGIFRALAWTEGAWSPIERFDVVGGPRLEITQRARAHLETESTSRLNAADTERWSRTIGALTRPVFDRLRASRVVIAGLGRSGSLAAHLLALQGLGGRLDLIDADAVELGNLDAMFGVDSSCVGDRKVDAVAGSLIRSRPDLPIVGRPAWIHEREGIGALRRADLVITTVDRDAPRLATALIANAYLTPHLDIGTGIFGTGVLGRGADRRVGADIRFLLPGDGCVRCVGGLADEEAARRELTTPEDSAPPATPPWSTERAGSLASVNAVAVGTAIQLWFDYLARRVQGSRWLRLEWRPDGALETRSIAAGPDPDCPVCAHPGLGDFRFGLALG